MPQGTGTMREANFREFRTCEVRRIPLLRRWVNKGKKKGRLLGNRPDMNNPAAAASEGGPTDG
jgi:hypothetical protein